MASVTAPPRSLPRYSSPRAGIIISSMKPRHRSQEEFLAFLRQIENEVPAGLDIHLIVDNDTTHKTAIHFTLRMPVGSTRSKASSLSSPKSASAATAKVREPILSHGGVV
jgi:hypothetical protein